LTHHVSLISKIFFDKKCVWQLCLPLSYSSW
jgi:hypothetical protein